MAVNGGFAASVAGYGSHAPQVLHIGCFAFRSARYRENFVRDISTATAMFNIAEAVLRSLTNNRLAADQDNNYHGSVQHHLWVPYSESNRHFQTLLPTVGLAKIACGYTTVNSFWPQITMKN